MLSKGYPSIVGETSFLMLISSIAMSFTDDKSSLRVRSRSKELSSIMPSIAADCSAFLECDDDSVSVAPNVFASAVKCSLNPTNS